MSAGNAAFSFVVALFIAMLTPSVAAAEMLVLESTEEGRYEAGARLADSNQLELPPCGRVKVLLFTSYETKVFTGTNCPPQSTNVVGADRGGVDRDALLPNENSQILPGDPTVPPPSVGGSRR